jgi:hypothetical protein
VTRLSPALGTIGRANREGDLDGFESTMSNSLQWRPTPTHLRTLSVTLMLALSAFGRVISVGGRSFAPHRLPGDALVLAGMCGAAVVLRPVANSLVALQRGWTAERRRRAGLARDRKLRASRKQFVAARRTHAEQVDQIYRSSRKS